jgi:hypothetical protein
LFLVFVFPISVKAQDDVAKIAIVARVERLQNWSAWFEQRVKTDFDPAIGDIAIQRPPLADGTAPPPLKAVQLPLEYAQKVEWRFHLGTSLVTSELDEAGKKAAAEGTSVTPLKEITSSSLQRGETLTVYEANGTPRGLIESLLAVPEDRIYDLALGLRLFRQQGLLTDASIREAQISDADENGVTLTFRTKDQVQHKVRYASKFAYAPVRYEVAHADGSSELIVCEEFREIEHVFVPYSVRRVSTYKDSAGKVRHPFTWTLHVGEVLIDDPKNLPPESLMISWPPRTPILDARVNGQFVTGEEPSVLTDAAIAALIKKHEEESTTSATLSEERARQTIDRGSTPATATGNRGEGR